MSIVGAKDAKGSDLFAIAQLLANPDKLKAEYDRLEALRAAAEDKIKLVAPAHEIMRLREVMAKEHAEAVGLKEAAKIEARNILNEARELASRKAAEAQLVLQEARAKATEMADAAVRKMSESMDAARKATLEAAVAVKRREELDAALAEAVEAKAKADAARERAEAELARIKAAVIELTDKLRG